MGTCEATGIANRKSLTKLTEEECRNLPNHGAFELDGMGQFYAKNVWGYGEDFKILDNEESCGCFTQHMWLSGWNRYFNRGQNCRQTEQGWFDKVGNGAEYLICKEA